ncbi:MAG: glycosyltransferase family 2 protein [Cellvibrionaceae bacterium]
MIDIVIVNWNAGSQLHECVDSVLVQEEDVASQVIVVDNGSTDGSVDAIEGSRRVEIMRIGENLGFAAACNRGAAMAHAPYLLFLNPDTRLFAGSLAAPLAFMERRENGDVGICGVQLVDEEDQVSRTCARFPTLGRLTAGALGLDKLPGLRGAGLRMTDWNHAETRAVDQVMGAFFLIRRDLFEELDGFDERFFVYFEEVDLSFRARQTGWRTIYFADAQAFHAGGGTSWQVKTHRLFYSLRSRLLYGFKHFPRWQSWLLVGVTIVLEPIARTVWCLMRRDVKGVHQAWAAYGMLWRGMRMIMRGEGRIAP